MLQRSGVPAMVGEIIRKDSRGSAETAALTVKGRTGVWGTKDEPSAFFHVFDAVSPSVRTLPFKKRIAIAKAAVKKACRDNPKCPIRMTSQIRNRYRIVLT